MACKNCQRLNKQTNKNLCLKACDRLEDLTLNAAFLTSPPPLFIFFIFPEQQKCQIWVGHNLCSVWNMKLVFFLINKIWRGLLSKMFYYVCHIFSYKTVGEKISKRKKKKLEFCWIKVHRKTNAPGAVLRHRIFLLSLTIQHCDGMQRLPDYPMEWVRSKDCLTVQCSVMVFKDCLTIQHSLMVCKDCL